VNTPSQTWKAAAQTRAAGGQGRKGKPERNNTPEPRIPTAEAQRERRHAAAARVRPPRLPRRGRCRAPLLHPGLPRLPPRSPAPAAAAALPRVCLLPCFVAALPHRGSRLGGRRSSLRAGGGEARDMHGRRAALRARAGHRVADRALAVPSAA
jgi:hypothetical protein